MKSAWVVGLCVGFVMLQGCAPQKTDTASAPATSTGTSTGAPPATSPSAAGPTPEQMAKMPQSQQNFIQYQRAMDAHNVQAASAFIDKAVIAAKNEHDIPHYIALVQQEATLKSFQKDNKGSQTLLENTLKELDTPTATPETLMRIDPIKALLAGMYAMDGKGDKSEAIYKQSLTVARAQKPVIHQRIAYWLRCYSDFYKFKKDMKHSDALTKESADELAKDPQAAAHGAPGGGPSGGAPGGGAQAPAHSG